jgi:DNA-directed RNA polymerase specialized sigma24 family protein
MKPNDPYQQTLQMDRETGVWDSPENLVEMYWEEEMTLEEIGAEVGVSTTTVHRRMKDHGIATRGPGPWTTLSTYRTSLEGVEEASDSHRTVDIHRLLMVAEHGVSALQDRDVHHKTKIPFDNRPKELQLLSHSEHTRLHNRIKSLPDNQTTLHRFATDPENKRQTVGFDPASQ